METENVQYIFEKEVISRLKKRYQNKVSLFSWNETDHINCYDVYLLIDNIEQFIPINYSGEHSDETNDKFIEELALYLQKMGFKLKKKEDNIYVKILKHNKNKGC